VPPRSTVALQVVVAHNAAEQCLRPRESSKIGREMHPIYDRLLVDVRAACEAHYGSRLTALAVFGSVGRGTPQPDSDVDLLLVVDGLPDGRMPRMAEFERIETAVEPRLIEAGRAGLHPSLSPAIKTPAEVQAGSPLLLDMTEDARILLDREGFLARALADFSARLARLGARRIWRGNAWYWDLKPDYKPGEVFEI